MTTKSILSVFLIGFALVLSACDKEAPGPSAADLNRCSHIDRKAELGEYLYDVCLRNPWPTELPPATQSGQSSFGGIINDTLFFVAGSPRAFSYETAFAATIHDREYRALRGGRGTWDEIDPRSIGLNIAVHQGDSFATITRSKLSLENFGVISGTYDIDHSKSVVQFSRWDDDVVSGTIDAWFIHPDDSTRQIHFTEGRFDLTVRPQ